MDHMEIAMSYVVRLEADELRALMAHAAGLHAHKTGARLTIDSLRNIADRIRGQQTDERMSAIAWGVANKYGMTLEDLKAPTRTFEVSHPRQEAMYLMRLIRREDGEPRYSFPQIAKFFGMKDHTTVLHGVRSHRRRVAYAAASAE